MLHSFARSESKIVRKVRVGQTTVETALDDAAEGDLSPEAAFWQSALRGSAITTTGGVRPLRVVDAFSGSGGLALGIAMAAQAIGRSVEFVDVIDTDAAAVAIHRHNLSGRLGSSGSVASMVDFHVFGAGDGAEFGYEPEVIDADLRRVGSVDMLIAGPPCQGHSNLNNHTRRQDPRNDLYVTAAALGVALGAEIVLIENVPTVQNSYSDVVATAAGLLRSSGYGVSMHVLRADELGAAQRRARHFLIAVRDRTLPTDFLARTAKSLAAPAMPLSWAIGDLIDREPTTLFDSSPIPTPVNQARIDYLFDHDLFDLPDAQRPDCHRNGTSYTAVYGRMHWDRPAQTITTGFGTPGQGRYVHPLKRRLITPREASRIQGFPDWFAFTLPGEVAKRKNVAKWIGDAVHPILAYAAGLCALKALSDDTVGSLRAA